MEKSVTTDTKVISLRPHHVLGLLQHEEDPEWYYVSDEIYLQRFRQEKGDFHSKRMILDYRNILKRLHENPNMRFLYVEAEDSICLGCPQRVNCHNPQTWQYTETQKADLIALSKLPKLMNRKLYNLNDITQLAVSA